MKSSKEYKVVLLPHAAKFYRKLHSSDQSHFRRVANALEGLKNNPFQGKPLRHKLKGKFSLRVGIYRIVYSIDNQEITVYVFEIGHRRNVYD